MEGQQNAYSPPQGELIEANTSYNEPKFLSLSGRIGRLRYLAYSTGFSFLSIIAIGLISVPMAMMMASGSMSGYFGLLLFLIYIPMILAAFAYAVRRLNDLNQSGWLSLLLLVPLVNFFLGLYLLFGRGTDGINRYGAPPPPNSKGVIFLSLGLPIFVALLGILAAIALPAYQGYVMRAKAAQQPSGYTQPADDTSTSTNEATDQSIEQEQPATETTDAEDAENPDNTTADESSTEGDETDNTKTTL